MNARNPQTPGVYVLEESGGSRPLGMVSTSTAGFVGAPPRAGSEPVTAINNWSQYLRDFVPEGTTSADDLTLAVKGFFDNGGSRCYVAPVAEGDDLAAPGGGLSALAAIDAISIVAAPGRVAPGDHEALLGHCTDDFLQDRVAILDGPAEVRDIERLTRVAQDGDDPDAGGLRPPVEDNGYGAFYFPHIRMRSPFGAGVVTAPPSGHMAGIWARTDATRGVHKAPANESIRGAVGLSQQITRQEQAELNPLGVNCLRYFPREGIRVWGARTLAPESSEWRYINVRRLFNMVKESIADGTRWIVFEPNDFTLWRSIRRDITAFLTRVWRDGALLGRTPEEAFFVKCDEETNPPEVRDAGQVVTIVGMAPVKPAEFVIFKLSQSADNTTIESIGG